MQLTLKKNSANKYSIIKNTTYENTFKKNSTNKYSIMKNSTKFKLTYLFFTFIICLMICSILFIPGTSAEKRELGVKIINPSDYSDIWLGISTGGYDLIAEKGNTFEFRIFVKNGMANRSINNVNLIPTDLPFVVNSITPKSVKQIKPMEIIIFNVNVTIPHDQAPGVYPVSFDVSANEFPVSIFKLDAEIEVVEKIKTWVYVVYTILIIAILGLLFYRKWKIGNSKYTE